MRKVEFCASIALNKNCLPDNFWAYSEMVSRVHGMDEAGVRFPVGPQTGQPQSECFAAVAVCRSYGESNDGAGDPMGRRAASSVLMSAVN